jgi:hemerythrin
VALLTWNHTCTVGVRAMDDQHGILMDTLNELRREVAAECDREQEIELLGRLIDFTRMHFVSEEQLMEESRFAGLAEHRAEHQNMLARMLYAAQRVRRGEALDMRVLLRTLREGYIEHVEGLDQEYGPWLNEKGIS